MPNKETPTINTEGLDSQSNLYHDQYWEVQPGIAGSEYEDHATHNARQLAALSEAMYGRGQYRRNGRPLTGAEAAREWYLKLGTHNSLHGARSDLERAAGLIISPESNQPLSIVEATHKLTDDDPSIRDDAKVLAVQMLIDAARDPSADTDGGVAEAKNRFYIQTAKKATTAMLARMTRIAERQYRADRLTPETRRRLSDTLKFKFEAEYMQKSARSEEAWNTDFRQLMSKIADERDKRKGKAGLGPVERKHQYIESPEELRQAAFLEVAHRQVRELREISHLFTNGELVEHYVNLLVRHTILSKDADIEIASATARQDQPHDGILVDGPLSRLSHDIVITNPDDNTRLFVQIKAENEAKGYHSEITMLDNIFKSDEIRAVKANPKLDEDTKKRRINAIVRKQTEAGLAQLQGALADWLGEPYEGRFDILEQHAQKIKEALDQSQRVAQPV